MQILTTFFERKEALENLKKLYVFYVGMVFKTGILASDTS